MTDSESGILSWLSLLAMITLLGEVVFLWGWVRLGCLGDMILLTKPRFSILLFVGCGRKEYYNSLWIS